MADSRFAGSYSGIRSLAFGREGMPAQLIDDFTPLPVRSLAKPRPTYRSGVINFTPAANATDFAALQPTFYGRVVQLQEITISGTASAPAVLDVLLQRSIGGGGGTSTAQVTAKLDQRDRFATATFYTYSANRTSLGNGIDANRALLAAGKLYLGTATNPAQPLRLRFTGSKRPTLRDLTEWLVLNFNGQAIPAGTSLDIAIEWSEETVPPVMFAGDSTTANANALFDYLGNSGSLTATANIANCGSNGYRLQDALLNLNGIPYPIVGGNGVISRTNGMPSAVVLCYGINDLRQGATSRAELVSMIDAAIYAIQNGTVAGATYTSPMGAGTSFTWPATIPANPDCKVLLWGPNSLATDGNGANAVTATGRFAGMALAAIAQTVSDDLYEAYEQFRDDPRVFRVVQKQDVFGRQATTVAASGLMTDILHPNPRGHALSARQIVPHLLDAIAACRNLVA